MGDVSMYNLMFIYKESKVNFNFIESMGSVLSIKELAKFLNRETASVYRSLKTLMKKKAKDIILKDKQGNKYLIITQNELNGRIWYK
jgi:predicted transcriptional regulator